MARRPEEATKGTVAESSTQHTTIPADQEVGRERGVERRLRILFLAHRIPYPPDKGDKIRSYHLLANLVRRHDVDLICHVDDPRDLRHREVLADLCRSVDVIPLNPLMGRVRALGAVLGGGSLSVAYMTRGAARRRVHSRLRTAPPDLVIAYSSQVAAYLPRELEAPLVLDLVDVDSEKWANYAAEKSWVAGAVDRLEARRLRSFEREIGGRAARVVLTTRQEAALYRRLVLDRSVVSITNGASLPDAVLDPAERRSRLMLFVGTMDYPPNVAAAIHAARDILPRVRAEIPEARFRIVGRHPTRQVRALAGLPGVEVTGEVPDLRPHLSEAALALLALPVARGVQTKVLESLAHGIPVVATTNVLACMEEGAGAAMAVADEPAELAAIALRLLEDGLERRRLGLAARAYVERQHDWRRLDDRWQRLLEEVLSETGPRSAKGS